MHPSVSFSHPARWAKIDAGSASPRLASRRPSCLTDGVGVAHNICIIPNGVVPQQTGSVSATNRPVHGEWA